MSLLHDIQSPDFAPITWACAAVTLGREYVISTPNIDPSLSYRYVLNSGDIQEQATVEFDGNSVVGTFTAEQTAIFADLESATLTLLVNDIVYKQGEVELSQYGHSGKAISRVALDSALAKINAVVEEIEEKYGDFASGGFSGSYNDLSDLPTLFDGQYTSLLGLPTLFSGSYADLSGTPIIPTSTSELTNNSGFVTLSDIPAGFSGNYGDLSGAPTVPSNTSELTNDSGFITLSDVPSSSGSGEVVLLSDKIDHAAWGSSKWAGFNRDDNTLGQDRSSNADPGFTLGDYPRKMIKAGTKINSIVLSWLANGDDMGDIEFSCFILGDVDSNVFDDWNITTVDRFIRQEVVRTSYTPVKNRRFARVLTPNFVADRDCGIMFAAKHSTTPGATRTTYYVVEINGELP